MTRINTNIPSLVGAQYMNRNMAGLNETLSRLSTGIRINGAVDSPSGIISTDVLRGELTGIQSAISNAERASNLMATADGAASGINDLLLELKSLVFQVANSGDMTEEEIEANQRQIDNIISSIDQTVSSVSFAGQKLLDGSLAYRTQGLDTAAITDINLYKAPVGSQSLEVPIAVTLQTAAEQGELVFPNAALAGDVTVRLGGPDGIEQFDFLAGTTSEQLRLAINETSEYTGLVAEFVGGNPALGVRIMTAEYGSGARVNAEVVSGNPADFALEDTLGVAAMTDTGTDIVLNVNGSNVVGKGLEAHYSSPTTDLLARFDPAWNGLGPGTSTSFEIVRGGTLFQLGPKIQAEQQVSIGVPAMDSTHLGNSVLGYLSDMTSGGSLSMRTGNHAQASKLVDQAINQVTEVRSRIGAFQTNTLDMALNTLKISQENISEARSALLDADYAEETAAMVRQQILVEATRAAMSLSHSVPERVLSLLLS